MGFAEILAQRLAASRAQRVQEKADINRMPLDRSLIKKESAEDMSILRTNISPLEPNNRVSIKEVEQATSVPNILKFRYTEEPLQVEQHLNQRVAHQVQLEQHNQASGQNLAKHSQPSTIYAGLKAAGKRKKINQRQDQKPLRTRLTYNADGSRNRTNRISDHEETIEKPKDRALRAGEQVEQHMNETHRVSKNAFGPAYTPRKKGNVERISRAVISVQTRNPSEIYDLVSIRMIIKSFLSGQQMQKPLAEKLISKLRSQISKASLCNYPDQDYITKSGILEQDGLPLIFDDPCKDNFPWDLRADAEFLWARFRRGELDGSLLRGIVLQRSLLSNGKKRTSRGLDDSYPYKKSPGVVGANGLIVGQWWESRMCAIRDGAHGVIEAGIYGLTDKGAVSIVVGSGGYADEDNGETIAYCGTASKTKNPSQYTKLLEQTLATDQPLRVLRAVNSKSKFAPSHGIRYDGLYKITAKEILDIDTAMFRYTLTRVKGQCPIRFQGPERRPNAAEITESEKIKIMMASKG